MMRGGAFALGRSSTEDAQGWAGQILQIEHLEVNQRVVVATEQTEVVDDGLAAVGPGDDVMDVTPLCRPSTPRRHAVTISGNDPATEPRRDHPGLAADVQHLGVGPEDHT